MEGNTVGGSQGFIDLTVPLSVGDAYTNLATKADGSVIGGPVSGSTALLQPLKGEPLTLDSIESMVHTEAASKLSTSMNIAMQWQGTSSVVALQVQLNSTDPSAPQVPVIPLYYDLATGALSTTKQGATGLVAMGVPAPAGTGSTAAAGKNPWLAGNVMVGFLIAYMELVNTLMKTKMAEGNLEIKGMEMTVSLADDSALCIMAAAQAQQQQHITAAICAGVSAATTIVCTGVSCGAEFQMRDEVDVPDQLPSKPVKGVTFNNKAEQITFGKGSAPATGTISKSTVDVKGDPTATSITAAGSSSGQDTSEEVSEDEGSEDGTDSISTASDEGQIDLDEEDADMSRTSDSADEEQADIDVVTSGKQSDDQQVQTQGQKQTEDQEETTSKEGEVEVTSKDKAEAKDEEQTMSQEDWDKERMRVRDERSQAQKNNIKVRATNRKLQIASTLAKGVQQVLQQGSQAVSEGVAANVAIVAGAANAQKEVFDAIRQVVASAYMHNMAEAFKSNSDLISQVLSSYDAMHQKLADAVAAALRH
jgi:hypothetical protein